MEGLPPVLLYALLAALIAAETAVLAGVFVPTLTAMLFGGYLARTGVLNLWVLLAVAVAAAVAGDALGHLQGRRSGDRMRTSRFGRLVGDERWGRTDALMNRFGGGSVFVARYVTVARTLVPRLVGAADIPYRRFVLWNVIGVVGWAALYVFAGYAAGAAYQRIATYFGHAAAAVTVLVLAGGALVLVAKWIGNHPEPVRALSAGLARWSGGRWLVARTAAASDRLRSRHGPRAALYVDLTATLVVLALIGWLLADVVRGAVDLSGLSGLDPGVARWLAARADHGLETAARVVAAVLRPTLVMLTVACVVAVRWRNRSADPFLLLAAVASLLALLGVAVLVDVGAVGDPAGTMVVTAGVGVLAWFLVRGERRWPRRVAVVASAVAVILLGAAAGAYLGRGRASELLAAVVVGALCTLVVVVAWRTRDRMA